MNEPSEPTPRPSGSGRAAFIVAGVVVALIGGFGLGRLTSGDTSRPTAAVAAPSVTTPADHSHTPGTGPHSHGGGSTGAAAGGLEISASGYTLVPESTTFAAGKPAEFAFRIVGAEQRPVTDFAIVHEKPLHMIVVRRDLTGYQHLHPTMAADGRWSVPLTLGEPGTWRAYADFTVDTPGTQTALTLGTDLVVRGDYAPRALPAAATEASAGGFAVSYRGTPRTGVVQPLLFTVAPSASAPPGSTAAPGSTATPGGTAAPGDLAAPGITVAPGGTAETAALERYLGAYGHLVVLREGDLGYVHVHPEPELIDGAVKFWLTAPSTGRYRMYFDFQVAGTVHTAEFTLEM
ncbi:hypothetical protein [Phytohabitans kaempferiae]|uniref:Secreted protein n=1 Tax=Phytohabitans kaempferiae TaxID=1620943 RepID=A0ABV6LVW3_9ACTN